MDALPPVAPPPLPLPRAWAPLPFAVPRSDVETPTTLLSTLRGAHSVGGGILGFFSTREARALRLVCCELREAVAEARWADGETCIKRSLGAWRACFPRARAANISAPSYPEKLICLTGRTPILCTLRASTRST